MDKSRNWRDIVLSDLGILVFLALAKLVIHLLTNGQYGFHRDELGMLDDARHLAWGYVSYPPLTAILMRLAWELFGQNLAWLRGYGDPPPQNLIVVGSDGEGADYFFSSCTAAATVSIPYGVENEIARDHPVIFLCRGLKMPCPQFWEEIKTYS